MYWRPRDKRAGAGRTDKPQRQIARRPGRNAPHQATEHERRVCPAFFVALIPESGIGKPQAGAMKGWEISLKAGNASSFAPWAASAG